jgi:hypothetical protein
MRFGGLSKVVVQLLRHVGQDEIGHANIPSCGLIVGSASSIIVAGCAGKLKWGRVERGHTLRLCEGRDSGRVRAQSEATGVKHPARNADLEEAWASRVVLAFLVGPLVSK